MILNFKNEQERNAHIYDRYQAGDWHLIFIPTPKELVVLSQLASDFFWDLGSDENVEILESGGALFVHHSVMSHDQLADWMAVTVPEWADAAQNVRDRKQNLQMFSADGNETLARNGIVALSEILADEESRRTGKNVVAQIDINVS